MRALESNEISTSSGGLHKRPFLNLGGVLVADAAGGEGEEQQRPQAART